MAVEWVLHVLQDNNSWMVWGCGLGVACGHCMPLYDSLPPAPTCCSSSSPRIPLLLLLILPLPAFPCCRSYPSLPQFLPPLFSKVVNLREVEGLAKAGVVFYAINVSVGISISLPGFSSDLAHGILGNLPFGAISMVGVRSMEEAGEEVWEGVGE